METVHKLLTDLLLWQQIILVGFGVFGVLYLVLFAWLPWTKWADHKQRTEPLLWCGLLWLALSIALLVWMRSGTTSEIQTVAKTVVQQGQTIQQEEAPSEMNWWRFIPAVLFGLSFGGWLTYRSWTGTIWKDRPSEDLGQKHWHGVTCGALFAINLMWIGLGRPVIAGVTYAPWLMLFLVILLSGFLYIPMRRRVLLTSIGKPIRRHGRLLVLDNDWYFPRVSILWPWISLISIQREQMPITGTTPEFTTRETHSLVVTDTDDDQQNITGTTVTCDWRMFGTLNDDAEYYLLASLAVRQNIITVIKNIVNSFLRARGVKLNYQEVVDSQLSPDELARLSKQLMDEAGFNPKTFEVTDVNSKGMEAESNLLAESRAKKQREHFEAVADARAKKARAVGDGDAWVAVVDGAVTALGLDPKDASQEQRERAVQIMNSAKIAEGKYLVPPGHSASDLGVNLLITPDSHQAAPAGRKPRT